jgi:hypothetical protein
MTDGWSKARGRFIPMGKVVPQGWRYTVLLKRRVCSSMGWTRVECSSLGNNCAPRGQSSPNNLATYIIFNKLPKLNNRPIGENLHNAYVENIIVIYLVGSDPSLFPRIFHCLILFAKLLTPTTYFHGSASVLYILLYRPLFFSIVLDSKPFGSNKGYHLCSPLPSFPHICRVLLLCVLLKAVWVGRTLEKLPILIFLVLGFLATLRHTGTVRILVFIFRFEVTVISCLLWNWCICTYIHLEYVPKYAYTNKVKLQNPIFGVLTSMSLSAVQYLDLAITFLKQVFLFSCSNFSSLRKQVSELLRKSKKSLWPAP